MTLRVFYTISILALTPLVASDVESEISTNNNNFTALRTVLAPPWVSSPNVRGTMDILMSCIFTLVSCIYTAMHLNVPTGEDKGWRADFRRKGFWVLISLLAPEIVLYVAAAQLLEARKLKKEVNRCCNGQSSGIAGEDVEARAAAQDEPYDLQWCFFIVMGGVRVPIDDMCPRVLKWRGLTINRPPLPCEATLTAKGAVELVKAGYRFDLLPLTREAIEDRSKQAVLQKCLVVGQVAWMALQCAVRKAYGLPLTLLEIHTMVHVACALSMYGFWMKKPHDVHEPERLRDDDWADMFGLMAQASFFVEENVDLWVLPPAEATSTGDGGSTMVFSSREKALAPSQMECENVMMAGQEQEATRQNMGSPAAPASRLVRVDTTGLAYEAEHFAQERGSGATRDTLRWTRCAAAVRDVYGGVAAPTRLLDVLGDEFANTLSRGGWNVDSAVRALGSRVLSLMQPPFLLKRQLGLVSLMTGLSVMYGGVHLTAWDALFPTVLEAVLWRAAGVVIVCMLPCLVVLWILGGSLASRGSLEARMRLVRPCRAVAACLVAVYGAARMYLMVEALVSLRRVPIGVYSMPDWLQMVPHL